MQHNQTYLFFFISDITHNATGAETKCFRQRLKRGAAAKEGLRRVMWFLNVRSSKQFYLGMEFYGKSDFLYIME